MSESEQAFVSVPNVPIPAPPAADAPAAHHANWLHSVLAALEASAEIVSSPTVVAILPPKYRTYATVIGAIASVAQGASPASAGLT